MEKKSRMPPRANNNEPQLIPLVDLSFQNNQVQDDILAAISKTAQKQDFINGQALVEFESQLAGFLGVKHAIGVSSGTDALLIALMALGIGPGDEVVTTPFSFISTTEVIHRLGAKPVFADITKNDWLIDPAACRRVISDKTKAIIPVHLYGNLCEMELLQEIAAERNIPIVEDCAQALGASLGGTFAGGFGRMGAFSFFPTKILGGWGDGGLVTTNDTTLAEKLCQIRNHGSIQRDHYLLHGGNFRLDTLQAVVLSKKFEHLSGWLQSRKEAAQVYERLFADGDIENELLVLPRLRPDNQHVFNLYVVYAKERERLRKYLAEHQIACGVYYPTPLHLQPCYSYLGHQLGDFPMAEEAAESVLALPFYPGITLEQQARVVEKIVAFYKR
jgi:dTDP-4-amino-4,6-dideoxygalactose transaminase